MSLDASRALPSTLKSFALTHILYDPTDRTAIPLTLLSLSPIFLFVAYFTLAVFTRRLSVVLLALGSVGNEALSLALKRWLKGERPYKGMGLGEVGDGYGMPSSHSQAAGFVCAWGVGYALASQARRRAQGLKSESRIGVIRRAVYVVGLIAWSALVAYSRYVNCVSLSIRLSYPLVFNRLDDPTHIILTQLTSADHQDGTYSITPLLKSSLGTPLDLSQVVSTLRFPSTYLCNTQLASLERYASSLIGSGRV